MSGQAPAFRRGDYDAPLKICLTLWKKLNLCDATLKILDMNFNTSDIIGEIFFTVLSTIEQFKLKTIEEKERLKALSLLKLKETQGQKERHLL